MWKSKPRHLSSKQTNPARVVIGVTGHRTLDNITDLEKGIERAINRIRQMVPPMVNPSVFLSVLSPIAEGADRLVAKEVLKDPESTLEVVLPLEKDDYIQDFITNESKAEFEELLSEAKSVRVLPAQRSRTKAYERIGRYVVDNCDVLIAIWDGKSAAGQGGTAEIVQYARAKKHPCIWIHAKDPTNIVEELEDGLNTIAFQSIDRFNSERVDANAFDKKLRETLKEYESIATCSSLPYNLFAEIIKYMQSYYVWADLLALRYQHRYHQAEKFIYILAILAVAIATFQILFYPEVRYIVVAEVLAMGAVVIIYWLGQHQQWHTKWIDYRFLAERLRSALFMSIVNIQVSTSRQVRQQVPELSMKVWMNVALSPFMRILRRLRTKELSLFAEGHLDTALSAKDWIEVAFSAIWLKRPKFQDEYSPTLKELKDFVALAWVYDQLRYHSGTRKRHYLRHILMVYASYTLFALTMIIAMLHIFIREPHLFDTVLAFMVIVLPAIAFGINAIRTHRDYLRNAMRSSEMVHYLDQYVNQMNDIEDYDDFTELMEEIEDIMLRECEDWRVVIRVHPLMPAA